MDDVVQIIKIEDIVPRSNNSQEDIKTLEELINSIKDNGIKEPLILKRKNNRYEIISGTRRYKAAIIAGLSEVPAIIKTYDNNISQNSINNNFDVINLSELNMEYERDELNMNNQLLNNNNIEQSTNNTGVSPSFGGRFFPSLEDEPTNMSFNQTVESAPVSQEPVVPGVNNSFIDLTDTSSDFQNNNIANVTSVENQNSSSQIPILDNSLNQPTSGNIINLENLTQSNGMVQQAPASLQNANIDNNFQEIINDFQPNQSQFVTPPTNPMVEPLVSLADQVVEVPNTTNLNVEPQQNIQQETLSQVNAPLNNTFNIDQQPMMNQQSIINNPPELQSVSATDMTQHPENTVQNVVQNPFQSESIGVLQQQPVEVVQGEKSLQPQQQKNVLPVINVLKSVGTNLESFGYTIRITDEDLPTSYKITIEVDK